MIKEIMDPAKTEHEYDLLTWARSINQDIKVFSINLKPRTAHMKLKKIKKDLAGLKNVIIELELNNKSQQWWIDKFESCGFIAASSHKWKNVIMVEADHEKA